MTIYVKGTNTEIRGTLERSVGVALASEFAIDEEGAVSVNYTGDTDHMWDNQQTVLDEQGRPIFCGADGNTYTVDQIENRDD